MLARSATVLPLTDEEMFRLRCLHDSGRVLTAKTILDAAGLKDVVLFSKRVVETLRRDAPVVQSGQQAGESRGNVQMLEWMLFWTSLLACSSCAEERLHDPCLREAAKEEADLGSLCMDIEVPDRDLNPLLKDLMPLSPKNADGAPCTCQSLLSRPVPCRVRNVTSASGKSLGLSLFAAQPVAKEGFVGIYTGIMCTRKPAGSDVTVEFKYGCDNTHRGYVHGPAWLNVMSLCQHSCRPNLVARPGWLCSGFHALALQAKVDINAGDELCWKYLDRTWSITCEGACCNQSSSNNTGDVKLPRVAPPPHSYDSTSSLHPRHLHLRHG